MIAIDFAPGSHGFFLEYVVNRWIYQVPYSMDDPFQSSGSSHKITQDSVYQSSKVAHAEHYSVFSNDYPKGTEKNIVIKHCSKLDYVLITNMFYRTHQDAVKVLDYPTEKIQQYHIDEILNNGESESGEFVLRNRWYDKLYNRDIFGIDAYQSTTFPRFEFDYRAFFNFPDFIIELQRLSKFLNFTLSYDIDLWHIWKKFIDTNQGWNAYTHANTVLTSIYSNQPMHVECDWKLHAWINTCLSRSFQIYSGILFDDIYPTDTKQIYQIIQEHLNSFDQQF